MTIPTAIGLIQFAVGLYEIVTGDARPILLLFMLPALLVGYLFGRGTKIAWDDESAQVSLIQAQLLLAISYVVVRVGTHYLLERTLSSRIDGLAIALLLVSFGLFFGRSIGLAVQIWHALVSRDEDGCPDAAPPPAVNGESDRRAAPRS
ncbi:MAG: hypothetical protein KC438_11380 [Thermomicrobiales bacterium]|nr:hypothetical protein [Thermomicrobiales bacterium]